MAALHTGYAAQPEKGRTLPPSFDPENRTIILPLDDPVGLRVADAYATALWRVGRHVEAGAISERIHDPSWVAPDRVAVL